MKRETQTDLIVPLTFLSEARIISSVLSKRHSFSVPILLLINKNRKTLPISYQGRGCHILCFHTVKGWIFV